MGTKQTTADSPAPIGLVAPGSSPIEEDRKPSSGRVPWGPWVSVLYPALVYYLGQYAALLLLIVYPLIRGWNHATANNWLSNSVVAQFLYVLFAEGLMFVAVWWFIRRRKGNLRSIGWQKFSWWYPSIAIMAYVVYAIGYRILLAVTTQVFPSLNVNQKQQLGFQSVSGDLGMILTFVSLVILPPLVEETVFRGFMFTGLRNKLKWIWAALITSLVFASAHLELGSGQPPLWVAALDTFTLSMTLCYLRQKTDSLWPGIFLHALKNGIAFVTLFVLHIS